MINIYFSIKKLKVRNQPNILYLPLIQWVKLFFCFHFFLELGTHTQDELVSEGNPC